MFLRDLCSEHFSSLPFCIAYVARKCRRIKIFTIEATLSCDVEVGQSKDDGIDMENIISSAKRSYENILHGRFWKFPSLFSLFLHDGKAI